MIQLMLRLVFWTNMLQRALTCLMVLFIPASVVYAVRMYFDLSAIVRASNANGGVQLRESTPAEFLRAMGEFEALGWILMGIAIPCLIMAGVYWRIISAPRIVRLAPHGRWRLLAGVMAVVLLSALFSMVMRWLPLAGSLILEWKVVAGIHDYEIVTGIAMAALVFSAAVLGLFVASRSPLAALLLLVVVLSPVVVATDIVFDLATPYHGYQGADTRRQILPLLSLLPLLAMIWIPFAMWYLRERRISFPGWLSNGGQDVLATSLVSQTPPKSRSEALQRQLLGGTTVGRFGAQWFVILGLLLGLEWLLARLANNDPALMARVMYASICFGPVVTTVVSFAAIRRSRSLWLVTSSTRAELFKCVSGILGRLSAVMALVFAIWLTVLWYTLAWRPGTETNLFGVTPFHFSMLLWLGWFAITAQLAGWSRWTSAIIAVGALVTTAWLSSMAVPNAGNGALALALALLLICIWSVTFALRRQAQRHWREGDFPRAVISTASGT